MPCTFEVTSRGDSLRRRFKMSATFFITVLGSIPFSALKDDLEESTPLGQ